MTQYEICPQGSHSISLAQAVQMTTLYRQNRNSILKDDYQNQNILAISETFNGKDVASLLGETGCVGLRIYYGMSEDLKVHAILVGVGEDGVDILPSGTVAGKEMVGDGSAEILEDSQRCPIECPPASPLNP